MVKGTVIGVEGTRYRIDINGVPSMPIPAIESVRHKEAVLGDEHVIEKDEIPLKVGDSVICLFWDDALKIGYVIGKVSE